MDEVAKEIYPAELVLEKQNASDTLAEYLDLELKVVGNRIHTRTYDKRDAFPFPVVNFPTLSGNIHYGRSHGVVSSQWRRFALGCSFLADFQERSRALVKRVVKQGFSRQRLQRSWETFTTRNAHLLTRYGRTARPSWTFEN